MHPYQPPVDACVNLLFKVIKADQILRQIDTFADRSDYEFLNQVLEEMGKFVGEVISPLQSAGDEQTAQCVNHIVTTPTGFAQAYRAFYEAGWVALSSAEEHGGQGLPSVIELILYDWATAANHSWSLTPGLLHGGYECVRLFASPELQSRYLNKLATGQWLATMCLTEAHAGSDLGLLTTRAEPQTDGSYRIVGRKIFISGGEHDYTENIIHLVLARKAGSPAGVKGLSLFLVPKLLDDNTRNSVYCERLEAKMGLHGNPTCAMHFDQAQGWLIGEVDQGLAHLFVMMNYARLFVAIQGIGLLDAAWQKALIYANERVQMRVPGERDKSKAADPIIQHPAIQKILNCEKVWIEAGRIVAYTTAIEIDLSKYSKQTDVAEPAKSWSALITPIIKAAWTDQAFYGASQCLQVFGGHGYIREWGIEQIVRDARITMIYEGTNEIQAQDLLFRKVLRDNAESMLALIARLAVEVQDEQDSTQALLKNACTQMQVLCLSLTKISEAQKLALYSVTTDFLRLAALMLVCWAWVKRNQAIDDDYTQPCSFALKSWIWPEFSMRLSIVQAALEQY